MICDNSGKVTTNGGGIARYGGGAGGNGSITIGNVNTGTFIKDEDEDE